MSLKNYELLEIINWLDEHFININSFLTCEDKLLKQIIESMRSYSRCLNVLVFPEGTCEECICPFYILESETCMLHEVYNFNSRQDKITFLKKCVEFKKLMKDIINEQHM